MNIETFRINQNSDWSEYPFIQADNKYINKNAFDMLKTIASNPEDWEAFTKQNPEGSRRFMLGIINDLMKGVILVRDDEIFNLNKKMPHPELDALREEFEPKFENGQPF